MSGSGICQDNFFHLWAVAVAATFAAAFAAFTGYGIAKVARVVTVVMGAAIKAVASKLEICLLVSLMNVVPLAVVAPNLATSHQSTALYCAEIGAVA